MAGAARRTPRRGRRAAPKPAARKRVRGFVFDGQGEHERFGVFDPAARMTYGVGVLIAFIMVGLAVRESMAPGGVAAVMASGAALMVAVLGLLGYRRVWRPPREREVLLQLAREQDESRALSARREREAEARRRGAGK